ERGRPRAVTAGRAVDLQKPYMHLTDRLALRWSQISAQDRQLGERPFPGPVVALGVGPTITDGRQFQRPISRSGVLDAVIPHGIIQPIGQVAWPETPNGAGRTTTTHAGSP